MGTFSVGVGSVTMHLRHSRSRKDKRQVVQSLVQKLRNQGFSVAEVGDADNPKRGTVAYTFTGRDHEFVRQRLDEAHRVFEGDFTVTHSADDIFNYGEVTDDANVAAEFWGDGEE